jgi:hypothetical protein
MIHFKVPFTAAFRFFLNTYTNPGRLCLCESDDLRCYWWGGLLIVKATQWSTNILSFLKAYQKPTSTNTTYALKLDKAELLRYNSSQSAVCCRLLCVAFTRLLLMACLLIEIIGRTKASLENERLINPARQLGGSRCHIQGIFSAVTASFRPRLFSAT